MQILINWDELGGATTESPPKGWRLRGVLWRKNEREFGTSVLEGLHSWDSEPHDSFRPWDLGIAGGGDDRNSRWALRTLWCRCHSFSERIFPSAQRAGLLAHIQDQWDRANRPGGSSLEKLDVLVSGVGNLLLTAPRCCLESCWRAAGRPGQRSAGFMALALVASASFTFFLLIPQVSPTLSAMSEDQASIAQANQQIIFAKRAITFLDGSQEAHEPLRTFFAKATVLTPRQRNELELFSSKNFGPNATVREALGRSRQILASEVKQLSIQRHKMIGFLLAGTIESFGFLMGAISLLYGCLFKSSLALGYYTIFAGTVLVLSGGGLFGLSKFFPGTSGVLVLGISCICLALGTVGFVFLGQKRDSLAMRIERLTQLLHEIQQDGQPL